MIGRLSGVLLEKNPPQLLLDVAGVGYEVQVSMSTLYHLPEVGEKVVLHTHLVIREDVHMLFGFWMPQERQIFRELIKISGVGPRTALAILSGLSVEELSLAVSSQEPGRLVKVPGIGKKTAERLLLELKGKPNLTLPATLPPTGQSNDILQALLALGYSEKEALATVKTLPEGMGVNEGIKFALKRLN